jgi:hypothetical protein
MTERDRNLTQERRQSAAREQLTATTDENTIELTEQELRRVAGGPKQIDYQKYFLPTIRVSSYY